MDKKLITIGKIVNTQGHKGEVRVIPLTDFPERFTKMESALVNNEGKLTKLTIENTRRHKQFIILKFKEVIDMNGAERLKNSLLQVTEEELVQLKEDEFYIFQLINLEVYNQENQYLGKIKEVFQTGANDVYLVKSEEGKEILLPAIKDVIKQVDLEGKKVIVSPMEEY